MSSSSASRMRMAAEEVATIAMMMTTYARRGVALL